MTHTLHIETEIPASRKLEITLPAEIPPGAADLVLTVMPRSKRSTAQDLLRSDILGMWADRSDVDDSAAFARKLRDRAWRRSSE